MTPDDHLTIWILGLFAVALIGIGLLTAIWVAL